MGTCLICNQPTSNYNNGNPKKYCSPECIKEANNKRRRKTENGKRTIWEGDKKICIDCGIAKDVTEYHKKGAKYNPKCKECIKPQHTCQHKRKRETYKFICKQCNTPATHYDKRYTTFCSRECSFAYKQGKEAYTPKSCARCGTSLIGRNVYKFCEPCKKEIEKEKQAIVRQKQIEQERIRLEKEKEWQEQRKNKLEQKRLARIRHENSLNKICPSCDKPFHANSTLQKLCGECKKIREFIRDIKRGKRSAKILPINVTSFDADITLAKLIKRDKNICHVCSQQCDKDDFTHNEKGAFIAKANYPSIDHVIALANGGTHTWDNIKLAHFYCNTIKRDHDIDETREQLQFFL